MKRAARPDVPWLTASAVGQAAYCPYQLYLARGGATRDDDAREALARGTAAHERWNERHRAETRPRLVAALRIALAIAVVAALALSALLLASLYPPR